MDLKPVKFIIDVSILIKMAPENVVIKYFGANIFKGNANEKYQRNSNREFLF